MELDEHVFKPEENHLSSRATCRYMDWTLYRLPTGALTHPEQKQHQILYKLQDHLQNKGIFKQMINVFHSVICITGLKIEIELEKIFLSRMFVLILSEDKKSHHSEALE